MEPNLCLNCINPIVNQKSHHPTQFCNHKCKNDFFYKQYISQWKAGLVDGVVGVKVSQFIRRYMFEKYNGRCARCSWHEVNPVTGKIPLALEHQNGNWRDNSEENLILLCPNCHSLTPTFGSLNKGKGRHTYLKMFENDFKITFNDIPRMFHYDVESGFTHPSQHDLELALDLNNQNRTANYISIVKYCDSGSPYIIGQLIQILGRINYNLISDLLPSLVDEGLHRIEASIREGSLYASESIPVQYRKEILSKLINSESWGFYYQYEQKYIRTLLEDCS